MEFSFYCSVLCAPTYREHSEPGKGSQMRHSNRLSDLHEGDVET